jgi:hypothetical protein
MAEATREAGRAARSAGIVDRETEAGSSIYRSSGIAACELVATVRSVFTGSN